MEILFLNRILLKVLDNYHRIGPYQARMPEQKNTKNHLIDLTTAEGRKAYKKLVPTRASLADVNLKREITNPNEVWFHPGKITGKDEIIDGRRQYVLHTYGVLPSGAKAKVMLTDLDVYFTVFNKDFSPDMDKLEVQVRAVIDSICVSDSLRELRVLEDQIIYSRGFVMDNRLAKGIRVFFHDFRSMKKALQEFRNLSNRFYLTCDDMNQVSYQDAISRRHDLQTANWWEFASSDALFVANTYEAKMHEPGMHPSMCDDEIYEEYRTKAIFSKALYNYAVPIKKIRQVDNSRTMGMLKFLEMDWDIETSKGEGLNDSDLIPRNINLFMIGLNLSWSNSKNDIMRICLIDKPFDGPVTSEDGVPRLHIICGSEEAVKDIFADIIARIQPDMIYDFNGGLFDWPVLYTILLRYDCVAEFFEKIDMAYWAWAPSMASLERYIMQTKIESGMIKTAKFVAVGVAIKISPDDTAYVSNPNVNGITCIDMCAVYRQRFPKLKKFGLNFFLKIIKEEPK
ncbi:hypothetical protein KDA11_05980, partial [Candidatus Saccharibacteria bacterium]|nr:hypothetical protein [Candidatus Saccharibacteria bacterium]